MAELARHEHDLAPMMAFMGDEIGQHVPHVKRQVAPYIRRRRRNLTVPLTRYRSTAGGTAIPCGCPRALIHPQRALWRWAASIRIVRRGEPGTAAPHNAWGSCSTRKTVMRLVVDQASRILPRSGECISFTGPLRMV
jgi:hypothetical protein